MSPQDQNILMQAVRAIINRPAFAPVVYILFAAMPDGEEKLKHHSRTSIETINDRSVIDRLAPVLDAWLDSLGKEYARATRGLSRNDPFEEVPSNAKLFSMATVLYVIAWVTAAIFLAGVIFVLNTVSVAITGSGEIHSLVNAPLRAAMFAIIPVGGMAAIHFAVHFSRHDRTKRIIKICLIAFVTACVAAWCIAFSNAFPFDQIGAPVSANMFEAAGSQNASSHKFRILFYIQLLGEIAFGGLAGIMLEHFFTRGNRVEIQHSEKHAAWGDIQSSLLDDRTRAMRLRGLVDDYARRFQATIEQVEAEALAKLNIARLRLDSASIQAKLAIVDTAGTEPDSTTLIA